MFPFNKFTAGSLQKKKLPLYCLKKIKKILFRKLIVREILKHETESWLGNQYLFSITIAGFEVSVKKMTPVP